MEREYIYRNVKDAVVDVLQCEPNRVQPDTKLAEDLGADSIDFVEVVVTLEDLLDFEVPSGELEKIGHTLSTVNEVCDFVEKYINP